jgi:hypothetical protein
MGILLEKDSMKMATGTGTVRLRTDSESKRAVSKALNWQP